MEDLIKFEHKKGVTSIKPTSELAKSFYFTEDEQDEAILASALGKVAEKNGLSNNDLMYVFPYILRMLRSDIPWAGNKK